MAATMWSTGWKQNDCLTRRFCTQPCIGRLLMKTAIIRLPLPQHHRMMMILLKQSVMLHYWVHYWVNLHCRKYIAEPHHRAHPLHAPRKPTTVPHHCQCRLSMHVIPTLRLCADDPFSGLDNISRPSQGRCHEPATATPRA